MWHCPFKFSFKYWALKDKDGKIKKSCHLDNKDALKDIQEDGDTIVKLDYQGCPRHEQPDNEEIDDEFSL